jgi:hypothetical protein
MPGKASLFGMTNQGATMSARVFESVESYEAENLHLSLTRKGRAALSGVV